MDILRLNSSENNPQKRCTACDNWFPATSEFFTYKKTGKYGVGSYCKDCRKAKRKAIPKPPSDSRRCSHCGQMLPATAEFFHQRGDGKNGGLTSHCKECRNTTQRAKRGPRDVVPQGYKKCSDCKEIYSATLEFFSRQSMVKSGLRSYCKLCARKRHEEYYERAEVKEHQRVRGEDYRNRPEVKRHRHEHAKCYIKRPEVNVQMRIIKHNRRALEKSAQGTYTAKEIQEQYIRQKGKCYYCQHKVKWGEHHVDHVIPLSRGGSNDISNLVIACATCNISKSNRLPHEWPKGGRLL